MVRLALIHPFLNFHEVDLNRTPVREWRQFERSDPFVDLNDREFKLQYRFSKQSVLRLVSELSPYLVDDKRKHCLSPLQLPLPHLELMLDFAHFWLGGVATGFQVLGINRERFVKKVASLLPKNTGVLI